MEIYSTNRVLIIFAGIPYPEVIKRKDHGFCNCLFRCFITLFPRESARWVPFLTNPMCDVLNYTLPKSHATCLTAGLWCEIAWNMFGPDFQGVERMRCILVAEKIAIYVIFSFLMVKIRIILDSLKKWLIPYHSLLPKELPIQ